MKQQLKKTAQGFTIIEVLIVLAIAGLIMAIVFLAVPALQRNSRNNAIKTDAANLVAALNEFSANNSGSVPANGQIAGCGTGTVTLGAAPAVTSEAKTQGATACSLVNGAAPAWPAGAGTVVLGMNYKCNGQGAVVASQRSVVALFQIENTSAGGLGRQCTGS